ncbi:MAG TPA: FMN-binding protein [Actinomycetota bacterium]
MRRAVLALAATAAIVVGILHYRTTSAPAQFRITTAAGPTAVPTASPATPPAASSPPAAAPPTPGSAPSAAAASPAAHPAPTAAPSPAAPQGRTVTGPVVSTRYGDVQVQTTVSGGRLTDVQALQLPSDRARSAFISQTAAPMLRDEALQAQSGQIDTISGATYTSEAYAQSLQAALSGSGL